MAGTVTVLPTETKAIPLTRGKVALVDAEDYEWLSQYEWQVSPSTYGAWYAIRTERVDGERSTIRMHREIMWALPGEQVDHEDGDGLNNRRSNLRLATRSQNGANARKQRGTYSSRFKGVSWFKRAKKWHAYISVKKRRLHLGLFDNEEEAARAYDVAAREHFGEFARPNFPDALSDSLPNKITPEGNPAGGNVRAA